MAKFIPDTFYNGKHTPSKETVLAASAAIESLVEWEFCDCGCPNQRAPATKEAVDFLRLSAHIRVAFLD